MLHLSQTNIPTAQRIAQARLDSIRKIPYLAPELAEQIHLVAKQSVATLRGDVAAASSATLCTQVRDNFQQPKRGTPGCSAMRSPRLPPSPHVQVITIPGIGQATAAALVAKIGHLDRFATPEDLVGYFGVFRRRTRARSRSIRQPLPTGRRGHVQQGQRSGSSLSPGTPLAAGQPSARNPVVKALFSRLRKKGTRGDVAASAIACASCSISSSPSGNQSAVLRRRSSRRTTDTRRRSIRRQASTNAQPFPFPSSPIPLRTLPPRPSSGPGGRQ